jgi:hypothetical protein
MKKAVWVVLSVWIVGLTAADARAQAKPGAKGLELVEVSGTVDSPDGGNPVGYSIRVPKGAQPSPAMVAHNRGYGVDVGGGNRVTVSVWRLKSEGNLDGVINYKANTYGGLSAKQDIDKDTHLATLKPMGTLQSVFLFKRISKGEHIEVECSGPPGQVEALKEACGSLKTK